LCCAVSLVRNAGITILAFDEVFFPRGVYSFGASIFRFEWRKRYRLAVTPR
jgi:hypothetical protein